MKPTRTLLLPNDGPIPKPISTAYLHKINLNLKHRKNLITDQEEEELEEDRGKDLNSSRKK